MTATGYIMIALHLFCILPSLILIVGASRTRSHLSRMFIWMVAFNIVGMVAEASVWYFENNASTLSYYAVRAADFFTFVGGYGQVPVLGEYLYACIDSGKQISRRPIQVVWAGTFISVILLVVSLFNHMYTYFDEMNLFHTGDWYFISQILPFGGFFILIYFTWRHRSLLLRRQLASLSYFFFTSIFAVAAFSLSDVYFTTHFIISLLNQMILYMNIQMDKAHQWEVAIAESRADVMLSQIRPHFMFNVLTAISQLCQTDPPKAQRAIMHFSKYLRSNMDSLTSKQAIPFITELQHVGHYLWLETLRFEEKLRVDFQIEARNFSLPPLTLQPLVENAVRHGLTKKKEGGTIMLRSEELDDSWRITVADDGNGFESAPHEIEPRSHVGLDNVRARLIAMCGGKLTIFSAPGQGTVIVIDLPKNRTEFN
ncbi:sensor histidine kinase [Deltaproteobacteria bacterium Smac51]|nr:sensor histidine kinase [Deltaproteobacteria bacterium Smac51]